MLPAMHVRCGFSNSGDHRAIRRAVHHAEKQSAKHKQDGGHHRFTGDIKRCADKVGDRQQFAVRVAEPEKSAQR